MLIVLLPLLILTLIRNDSNDIILMKRLFEDIEANNNSTTMNKQQKKEYIERILLIYPSSQVKYDSLYKILITYIFMHRQYGECNVKSATPF